VEKVADLVALVGRQRVIAELEAAGKAHEFSPNYWGVQKKM
jgi:hypothetical protein